MRFREKLDRFLEKNSNSPFHNMNEGVICIFTDNPQEMFDDFKLVLEDIYDDPDGIHTVFFSRYFKYKVMTEVVYVIKREGNFIFVEYPSAFTISLTKDLVPTRGDWMEAQTFVKIMYSSDNAEFVSEECDIFGNQFNIFRLPDDEAERFSKYWLENHSDILDHLHIEDQLFVNVSDNYLEIRKEKFKELMDKVLSSGEIYEGMDENPFSDIYYNSDLDSPPKEKSEESKK